VPIFSYLRLGTRLVVSQNSSNFGSHRRACTVFSRSATLSQPVTTSKSSDCSLSDTPLLLPRPQALINKVHASHYMKGLHEVVHRDEQAQGVMGLRHRKLWSAWEILCRFLQNSSVSCKSWFFDSLGLFLPFF
jgi:hypothetical protein